MKCSEPATRSWQGVCYWAGWGGAQHPGSFEAERLAEHQRSVNKTRLPGVMCANVTTTRYLNVKDDYLQELIERKPLVLIRS